MYSMSMLSSLCMMFQFQNLSVKLESLEEGTKSDMTWLNTSQFEMNEKLKTTGSDVEKLQADISRANIGIEHLTNATIRMNETTKENTDKILFQDSEVLIWLLQEYLFSTG